MPKHKSMRWRLPVAAGRDCRNTVPLCAIRFPPCGCFALGPILLVRAVRRTIRAPPVGLFKQSEASGMGEVCMTLAAGRNHWTLPGARVTLVGWVLSFAGCAAGAWLESPSEA